MPEPLLVAKAESGLCLLPQFANRHGLIAGATGTGKTVTLQRIAEGLSRIGVPVFMADVKGEGFFYLAISRFHDLPCFPTAPA